MSQYFCYRIFGLFVQSEIELPELSPVDAPTFAADVTIRKGKVEGRQPQATLHEELASNNPEAAFLIRNGREIVVDPRPSGDPAVLRVRLLGRVMAFLFRQRGWLPLHASGVLIHNQCVLFLGAARAGKSTTAAAFHKSGHLVVTDDVAPVRVEDNGCVLQSAWSCVRLRPDAEEVLVGVAQAGGYQAGKHRYDLGGQQGGGEVYTVRCAYTIEFGEEISAQPIDAIPAIPLLSRYSFVRHRQMAREVLERHLRDCSEVAAHIPVRRLTRPRSLHALPALVRFVEADLAGLRQQVYK